MGILDDAIKEHLELKRQHGAGESELQQLEDEAFGAAERPGTEDSAPDPVAEAPTEFMTQPDAEEGSAPGAGAPEGGEEPAGRRTELADLQEPPQHPGVEEQEVSEQSEPADEQAPAMEHEAIAEPGAKAEAQPEEPEISTGPSTEERHAIAEQPTQMFDVEEELGSQAEAPSEEALVEEEATKPRLAPVDPLPADIEEADEAGAPDEHADDADDEFWDEKRLSDELDQALEAPIEQDEESAPDPSGEPEGQSRPAVEAEPRGEEKPAAPEAEPEVGSEARDEDLLEETPDFLEEVPEDDELWFEQKPPKDFDFDD